MRYNNRWFKSALYFIKDKVYHLWNTLHSFMLQKLYYQMLFLSTTVQKKSNNILCIVYPSGLGDVLVTTPAIRYLKKTKNAEIYILIGSASATVYKNNPNVKGMIIWDDYWTHKSAKDIFKKKHFIEKLKLMLNLRRYKFSAIYDFNSSRYTIELALFCGTKNIFGYKNSITKTFYRNGIHDQRYYTLAKPINMVEHHLNMVSGNTLVDKKRYKLELYPSEYDLKRSRDILQKIKDFVVITPYARRKNKLWVAIKFSNLINEILNQYNLFVILDASNDGKEFIENVVNNIHTRDRLIILIGENPQVLFKILKKAKMLITPNTGCMHLAAAADCPIVLLQGPSSDLWLPWNARFISVRADSCQPCEKLSCSRERIYCMEDITVAKVIEKVGKASR